MSIPLTSLYMYFLLTLRKVGYLKWLCSLVGNIVYYIVILLLLSEAIIGSFVFFCMILMHIVFLFLLRNYIEYGHVWKR
jgi:hypothetical protein